MRKRYIILISTALILVILFVSYLTALEKISAFLAKSDKVEANILVVEGWLPEADLEKAFSEFISNGYEYLITTGHKPATDYYNVSMEGYLVFYLPDGSTINDSRKSHLITVDAYGELDGIHRSHFNLYVNDKMISDFEAGTKKDKYEASYTGELNDIDSVTVEFTNDGMGDYGDRNLYVKGISIDKGKLISYHVNSEYDIGMLDGVNRLRNKLHSYAEYARSRMIAYGADSMRVIATPGKKNGINRTFTSALALGEWVSTTELDVKGINIISNGTHARRTWMTYKRILDGDYETGIISLPDSGYLLSSKKGRYNLLRETFLLIYYWFLLIPF